MKRPRTRRPSSRRPITADDVLIWLVNLAAIVVVLVAVIVTWGLVGD